MRESALETWWRMRDVMIECLDQNRDVRFLCTPRLPNVSPVPLPASQLANVLAMGLIPIIRFDVAPHPQQAALPRRGYYRITHAGELMEDVLL